MIKNKKVAFVCTIHQSETHRPNGFKLFNDYLVSIYTSCKYPFKLFVFDNESDDKFEVENQPDSLVITRVDDQYKGGCTYTWNEGIKQAIKEDYDVVIITSDDQLYNETVNNFIDAILTHEHRDDAIFGPLSNNPNNDYQIHGKDGWFENYGDGTATTYLPNKIYEISGKPGDELNGFCLAMTKECIQNNYFDNNGNFFSTEQEYIWGKQDVEVQQRVGHSIVVGSCYVHHYKIGGWRKIVKGYRGK
jgi:GT2 family glycosyltransferase